MKTKLLLLPGMDGTGDLFAGFVEAFPDEFETEIVSYPTDVFLSYSELMPLIHSATPPTEPFVLVAESFSTPLAIQYAATNPPNLKGLVLCAGFVTSPVRGWLLFFCSLLSPVLIRPSLPMWVVRLLLVGATAPQPLLAAVSTAVSSVKPTVMSARFRAVISCDARVELGRVSVPILYVQATQDRLVRELCLDEIQRIRPEINMAKIVGPHLILQREPRQAAEVVAEFVHKLL